MISKINLWRKFPKKFSVFFILAGLLGVSVEAVRPGWIRHGVESLIESPKIYSACSSETGWSICFTPGADCTRLIVEAIDQAKQNIKVQAYGFTSRPIAAALIRAKARGVKVEILVDKSQRKEDDSEVPFLLKNHVSVLADDKHAIAHNKVMVLDRETVITGSFNFTDGAQKRNAENLLILKDVTLAEHYLENWDAHRAHAEAF